MKKLDLGPLIAIQGQPYIQDIEKKINDLIDVVTKLEAEVKELREEINAIGTDLTSLHKKEQPQECQRCHRKFSTERELVEHIDVYSQCKPQGCKHEWVINKFGCVDILDQEEGKIVKRHYSIPNYKFSSCKCGAFLGEPE